MISISQAWLFDDFLKDEEKFLLWNISISILIDKTYELFDLLFGHFAEVFHIV